MAARRRQFTIGSLMILIAIVAVVLAFPGTLVLVIVPALILAFGLVFLVSLAIVLTLLDWFGSFDHWLDRWKRGDSPGVDPDRASIFSVRNEPGS